MKFLRKVFIRIFSSSAKITAGSAKASYNKSKASAATISKTLLAVALEGMSLYLETKD